MPEPSDDPATGAEVIWLHDPGTDPEVAGPVAVDLTELDDLVDEALAALGQVALTGVVHWVDRGGPQVSLELINPTTEKLVHVFFDDQGQDDVGWTVGEQVTAVGRLTCRGGAVVLIHAERLPPITARS